MKSTNNLFKLLVLIGLVAGPTRSSAQFYLRANSGFNMTLMEDRSFYMMDLVKLNEGSEYPLWISHVPLRNATGINFGLNFGYTFKKNLGFELGVQHFSGSTQNSTGTDGFKQISAFERFREQTSLSINTTMWQVLPSLVLREEFGRYQFYGRFSAVLTFAQMDLQAQYSRVRELGGVRFNFDQEVDYALSGGFGLGSQVGIGLQFALSDKVNFFVEATYTGIMHSPSRGEMTRFHQDGVDRLPDLDTRHREFVFSNATKEGSGTADANKPGQGDRFWVPFVQAGLNFGLVFYF
jgi:hypothetical protein